MDQSNFSRRKFICRAGSGLAAAEVGLSGSQHAQGCRMARPVRAEEIELMLAEKKEPILPANGLSFPH